MPKARKFKIDDQTYFFKLDYLKEAKTKFIKICFELKCHRNNKLQSVLLSTNSLRK